MGKLNLNIDDVAPWVTKTDVNAMASVATMANNALHDGTLAGNDFLGWVNLPSSITEAEIDEIEKTAIQLRTHCDVVVVIGIGGSYLGAKAVIDALANSFDWLQTKREDPVVVYAGNNIGEDYLYELVEYLKDKSFGIINISKSGTTTEPALSFRILKNLLEKEVGKEEL